MPLALAEVQTVCTITINSADEKEVFVRHLPASQYRFVELVARGRPDWLGSACRADFSCDLLVISGHYDGRNEFFSERLEESDFLPVDELERVSCSDSCPGLLSRLKEVYLFGCNTLNPTPLSSVTAEIVRSLVREGHSLKEAEQRLRSLNAEHGESSRDRMRRAFKNVPVIYGFAGPAPRGPVAASHLDRYFRANGAGEIGHGHSSGHLLEQFAPFAMSMTQGVTDKDPHADVRRDVCKFVDDRLTDAQRLGFVHELVQRDAAQARVHLDRIQRYAMALQDPARQTPEVAQALAAIARDHGARARFLAFARDADRPAVRARMISVAHDLGWLSEAEHATELTLMLGELHARGTVGIDELDLACTLTQEHDLDGALNRRESAGSVTDDLPHAAIRACLGSAEGRGRVLEGLVSPDEADVRMAQAYLRHRPIADAGELRRVAAAIARMPASDAQVIALEALGRHYLTDQALLDQLVSLYSQTSSASVQIAVAGVLIRADRGGIDSARLARTLHEDRLPSTAGDGIIDALIRLFSSP